MILTGMQVSVQEMAAHGLVNRVVPKGEHLNEALKLAHRGAWHPQGPHRSTLPPRATTFWETALPPDAGVVDMRVGQGTA